MKCSTFLDPLTFLQPPFCLNRHFFTPRSTFFLPFPNFCIFSFLFSSLLYHTGLAFACGKVSKQVGRAKTMKLASPLPKGAILETIPGEGGGTLYNSSTRTKGSRQKALIRGASNLGKISVMGGKTSITELDFFISVDFGFFPYLIE